MTNGRRLVFRTTGTPEDVLELEEFTPARGSGNALVRMLAAPINPADLNFIEGTYGVKPELPATPGIEGCGEVVEAEGGGFAPGDRVIFLRRVGTWATHVTAPVSALLKIPREIDPLQAAMLKVNPATAWRLLHGFEALQAGEWVIQNAGNSAVGRCVIQLARTLGVRTVSFARRPELFDELRALGADEVFRDDAGGLTAARETMGGANASLAFNAVGGESGLRVMKLLREHGTHVTYGSMARKPLMVPAGPLIFRDIRVRGLWITRWIESAPPEEVREVYGKLAAHLLADGLVQPVDAVFPIDDWRSALGRLADPERNGKVLLAPETPAF